MLGQIKEIVDGRKTNSAAYAVIIGSFLTFGMDASELINLSQYPEAYKWFLLVMALLGFLFRVLRYFTHGPEKRELAKYRESADSVKKAVKEWKRQRKLEKGFGKTSA